MRLQVKRPDELELNLISLVDVVLLLVIFFMLSTTFVQDSRLKVELPKAGSTTVERSLNPIVITISAQGSYRVNDRALVNNESATLSAALRQVSWRLEPRAGDHPRRCSREPPVRRDGDGCGGQAGIHPGQHCDSQPACGRIRRASRH